MNRKRFLSFAAVLMLVIMTFSACGGEKEAADHTAVTSELSMAEDVKAYLEKVDMEYAYNLTETLAYDETYWDNELGWRTAGSDAEHRAANFLAKEMKSIGLTDIEKVPVKVDKFQFNDSSLTIEGTEIDLVPASYECSGTDKDGITEEIVDVGTGFAADYDGKDVKGKIVLAGVNQWDESWIDGYIRQAKAAGAAALVTYSTGGYGELNEDTANVQDICCPDLIPTVAISANEAKQIQEAIKTGNDEATLMVDAVLEEGTGTSYNVVGKIRGKSSDQQIMIAGHYDKYWYGFQDDCAAIALDFSVAKAMIDSGYQPENDIVVVAHGSEEWGATDSQFDWTTGAWEMIHTAYPEWAGKTIALLNCELPAFQVEGNQVQLVTVPEFRTLATKLVKESGLFVKSGEVTISDQPVDATNMEDGVSYRWHGVPYMINGFEDETFIKQRYHTKFDDKDTWDEDTIKTNVNWFGATAIYIDKMPALELDITAVCDDLEANLNDDIAAEAGVDVEAYKAASADLRAAAEAHNARIQDLNSRYEKAVAAESSEDEISKLREEGKTLNKITLKAFKAVQDEYLKTDDIGVYIGHPNINSNVETLQGVVAGLEKKELYAEDEESGALDIAWNLNSAHDYGYYLFDKEAVDSIEEMYDADKVSKDKSYWGTDKMVPVYYVGDTLSELVQQAEDENAEIDYDGALKVYQDTLKQALEDVKDYSAAEVKGMAKIADILK
ncbi:MAG: M28 family peptidase [Lentihominibacter sp.]